MRALLLAFVLAAAAITSAHAQDANNGRSLYQNYCQVCHGFPPSGGPELAPNNPALIQSAINGLVPQMSILRFLTSSQVADIAAYIASLSAPPPPPPPPPPPSTPPAPTLDYSDLWFNADESGWGFNIIQHSTNQIFGVMYTYDANRKPQWFVLPGGSWTSSTKFTGNWYRVTGPAFNGSFDATKVKVTQVGTAELSFSDASHGTLSFSVNGVVTSKNLTRQPF
jgi:cytochrome c553